MDIQWWKLIKCSIFYLSWIFNDYLCILKLPTSSDIPPIFRDYPHYSGEPPNFALIFRGISIFRGNLEFSNDSEIWRAFHLKYPTPKNIFWPLTYDPDLKPWPRYPSIWPTCQNSGSNVCPFRRESGNRHLIPQSLSWHLHRWSSASKILAKKSTQWPMCQFCVVIALVW